MPRKSAAALGVVAINSKQRRLKPPDDMAAPVKQIWAGIVDSLPGDRFHRSDVPLLTLYCRALYQASQAFDSLEKHKATNGDDLNPWLRVGDIAVKQAATLATKLRLCPQARLDRKTAGPMARTDHGGPTPWDE